MNPLELDCEIIYYNLVKVENENNGYGLVTFLVSHEYYGEFKVTEEIDVDGIICVATYYKTDLQGSSYDWSRYSKEEWHKMHIC